MKRLTLCACLLIGWLVFATAAASAAITTPNDLGNTVLWLDASDPATVIDGGTGLVNQWLDKSLVGTNHMLQPTGAQQPQTGVASLGGLNVLTLDGIDDHMATSPTAPTPAPLAAGDDDYTYFALWQPHVNNTIQSVYEQAGPGIAARSAILAVNNRYGFNGQNNDLHALAPFPPNEWRMTAMTVNDAVAPNIQLVDNGTSYAGTTSMGINNLNIGTAGATVGKKQQASDEYLNGDLAEVIVYDRVLSPAEQFDVMLYMDQKYSLGQFNPPTGPSTISGNVLWLDASDVDGDFAPDAIPDGTAIEDWIDKSPLGNHSVSQGDGAKQPLLSTGVLGGQPVVSFDGADDWMAGPAVLGGNDDNYTYIAVWKPEKTAGAQTVFEQSQIPQANNTRASMLAVGSAYGFNGQSNDLHWLVPFAANEWRVSAMTINNAEARNVYVVDNGLPHLGNTGDPGALSVGTTGAIVGAKLTSKGEGLDGDLAELLVYDRVLNGQELIEVGQYLDQKYGLSMVGAAPTGLLHQWTFEDGTADDQVGGAHGTLHGGAAVVDGRLVLDGIDDFLETAVIADAAGGQESIGAKTLVAWVSPANLNQQSGGVLALQDPVGDDLFDGIVLGEITPKQWMAGSNFHLRTENPQTFGTDETVVDPDSVMIAIVYGDDNSVTIYRDGALYGAYTKGTLQLYGTAASSNVVMGKRHIDAIGGAGTPEGNDPFFAGAIDEARIYGAALTEQQIIDLVQAGPVPEPTALTLWMLGLVGLLARRHRRRCR